MLPTEKPYIIGETAFHHQGEKDYLFKLIDAAEELGLDAIKFHLLLNLDNYFVSHHNAYEALSQWLFNRDEWINIIDYASSKNLDIVALVNDPESAIFINEKSFPNVVAVEIHATGINDIFLLHECSKFNGTVILGSGGSTFGQLQFAINILNEHGQEDIFLMHGFQNYPTDYKDINLEKIKTLQSTFNLPVGYADHTDPNDPVNESVSCSGVLKNANVIEKHFTLDSNEKRIDSQAAVSISQMKRIVALANALHLANGKGGTFLSDAEKKYGNTGPMKKAIVAKRKIKKGEPIRIEDLAYKRTMTSSYMEQSFINNLIGSIALNNIEKDEIIDYSNVKFEFSVASIDQFNFNKKNNE